MSKFIKVDKEILQAAQSVLSALGLEYPEAERLSKKLADLIVFDTLSDAVRIAYRRYKESSTNESLEIYRALKKQRDSFWN